MSPALAAGAFVFGLGMAIAGSCISAHLYRLGEGSPSSPFALIGAFFGFCLGFLTWNPLFMADLAKGPVLWLPHHLGYAGSLGLSLALIGALALLVVSRSRVPGAAADKFSVRSSLSAVFVDRWPTVLSGVLVAAIGTFAYLRFAPLGVTSQIGSASRAASGAVGLLPDTLYGLDSFRGCATVLGEALLTPNGHLVIGLVLGSFAAAFAANKFKPAWPSPGQIGSGLVGGVLMGWGAMTALGCTIGVLLSGIQAGAVAGWVFLVFCLGGALVGLRIRRPLSLERSA